MHGLRIPTKSAGDAGLMSATTAVAVVPDELLTGIKCISYDLIRRSVLAVRAVVSVDDGHAAMSFSFAKGSASIRV